MLNFRTSSQELWEKYRQKAVPLAQKREMIDTVLSKWKGNVMTVAARHDASRVVQSVFQYGTLEQQRVIMTELRGHLLDLCKTKHGHNIIEKVLRYGSPSMKALVHAEVKGNASRLMTHRSGITVLEAGYTKAWGQTEAWELLQEAYGPQFAHFKVTPTTQASVSHLLGVGALPPPGCSTGGADVATVPPSTAPAPKAAKRSLDSLLSEKPSERDSIVKSLYHNVNKLITKGFLGTTIAQRLLADLLRVASPITVKQIIPTITDAIVALAASRDGLLAGCIVLAYSNAKERKVVLSHLKTQVTDLAVHDHGHMLLVKALDCVDDTVQLGKAILKPLSAETEDVLATATDRFGRRIWLHLLAPGSTRYFPATDMQLLQPVWVPHVDGDGSDGEEEGGEVEGGRAAKADLAALQPAGADAASDSEDDEDASDDGGEVDARGHSVVSRKRRSGDGKVDLNSVPWEPTSKKAADLRRRELLKVALPRLRDAALVHTDAMMRDRWGAEVLLETLKVLVEAAGWASKKPLATPKDAGELLAAICDAIAEEGNAAEADAEGDVDLAASGAGAAAAAQVREGVHFGGGEDDAAGSGADDGEEEEEEEEEAPAPTAGRGSADDDEVDTRSLVEAGASTLLLKRLLALEREGGELGGAAVAQPLWAAVKTKYSSDAGPALQLLEHNRGCFLLNDLLASAAVGAEVKAALLCKDGTAALKAAQDCSGKKVLMVNLGLAKPDKVPAVGGKKRSGASAAAGSGSKKRRA